MSRAFAVSAVAGVIVALSGCGDVAPVPDPVPVGPTQIAYVGSGGCDGAMVDCIAGGDAEHIVQGFEISPTGQMTPRPDLAIPTGGQPVWLSVHRPSWDSTNTCLFVSRADKDDIAAFSVNPAAGKYNEVGTFKSGGAAPVFTDVLRLGEGNRDVLLVANYHGPDDANTSDGAAASTMFINEDCSLQLVDVRPHSGSSVNPLRQGGAHVHSFTATPSWEHNTTALACDLGQDKIMTYKVGSDAGLTLESTFDTPPGVGPRHLVHTSLESGGNYVYVVTEMGESVLTFEQSTCDGEECLKQMQILSLVAEGQSMEGSKSAEIVISNDGRTVYASNRGLLNTVTVFGVNHDGTLTQKQQVEAPVYPRGMTLALNGRLLLVASQANTEVASYSVGWEGLLTRTGFTLKKGLPPHPAAFAVMEERSESIVV